MLIKTGVSIVLLFLSIEQAVSFSPFSIRSVSSLRSKGIRSNNNGLQMAVYTSADGVPATLTEERDACGVGFIASLNNKPSHDIVKQALAACTCMEHRGATSADKISGDGAGVMTNIPWKLFSHMVDSTAVLNKDGSPATAVGMVFLPKDEKKYQEVVTMIESVVALSDFKLMGWRDVPVNPQVLGELSRDFVPRVRQMVLQLDPALMVCENEMEFRKLLYPLRREMQGYFRKLDTEEAYVCSLSAKTIVYKGMLRSCDLGEFYLDLQDPDYETAFAVYHRRFSTNTVPKWFLAQPMRLLAHNGEINTLLGNINWVKSRQYAVRNQLQELFHDPNLPFDPKEKPVEDEQIHNMLYRVRGPLVDVGRSDSANLDSILENYLQSGSSPEEALMKLVPEAYDSQPQLKNEPAVKAFYEYFESLQEAWDGPALLVFADGDRIGAALDRNGLRPARYMLTEHEDRPGDVTVHMMSEVGVTKVLSQFAGEGDTATPGLKLISTGRLGPGQMLAVHLSEGKLYLNDEVKRMVADQHPYEQWMQESVLKQPRRSFQKELVQFAETFIADPIAQQKALNIATLEPTTSPAEDATAPVAQELDSAPLITSQTVFGWGTEDVEVQITAMAKNAMEATYSMGDDAPLAALSVMPHTLYDYFKQRFAQVTNPPIDPLREGAVMSLTMFMGPRGDPFSRVGQLKKRVKIESPVLNLMEFEDLTGPAQTVLKTGTISTTYPLTTALQVGGLEQQVDKLCREAIAAVRAGCNVINLTDRDLVSSDVEKVRGLTYVPPLLAVASVHHALIRQGLRSETSLVVTTGSAWSTHHIACLVGYGATAVIPYAAYDAVINWHGQKRNQNSMARGDIPSLSALDAVDNYRKALDKGLLKILSKMGISLLTSYQGAQIFEAVGIDDQVLKKRFTGTACRVSGMTLDDIAAEVAEFSRRAYGDDIFTDMPAQIEAAEEGKSKKLFNYGFLNYLRSGDYHHNNQPLVKTLHSAIREHKMDLYKLYEESVTSRPPTTVRDTLQFAAPEKAGRSPVPLEEVESAEAIMKRFCTGGMSLGALSREAHETLAISMNRIGGRSNSGEGGEDPVRRLPITDVDEEGMSASYPWLKGLRKGDNPSSKVKQVASGRFGVTPQYLMSAEQLEIKVAQGAKPGEGGQLPGAKIDSYIAGLRKSKPGVTLISPPPHHDIYSIEDLAQLIYDLHQINPEAAVSVKLVSEVGIGTVASGVTKAGADIIQIAGHDGGTGASPLSSIKYAGSPWELGLVETHATLRKNALRERVVLRVDGGLKSGWDVVMGAAMGAEEFGFGTIALIAEGCIMARICHTNKCPVGVTTQNAELRKRFPGTPDNVVTYFNYVAEEVRHILAKLGFRSLDEMIGLPGVLEPRTGLELKKTKHLDISFITDSLFCESEQGENFCPVEEDREWLKHGPIYSNGFTMDDAILQDTEVQEAMSSHGTVVRQRQITNTDRAAFARVSGQLAKKYGDGGFKGKLRFELTGAAGQSFGAFLSTGMELRLSGYGNDYVGKGMNGGEIVLTPPLEDLKASLGGTGSMGLSMVGNTVLYGATGGSLFVRGRAGERFAVRNSGALGVIEGLGDHGAEYMTGGNLVCLGSLGRNFGAGMTGGLAFLLPDEQWLSTADGATLDPNAKPQLPIDEYINPQIVTFSPLSDKHGAAVAFLKETLSAHVAKTGSARAQFVLDQMQTNLADTMSRIWLVVPPSEKDNALVQVQQSVDSTQDMNNPVASVK